MRILILGAKPELVDLVEQAALAADIGPFEIHAERLAPEHLGAFLAHDAIVVEHAPPEVESMDVVPLRLAMALTRPASVRPPPCRRAPARRSPPRRAR